MPSSKGTPTNKALRDEIKRDVQDETNKDGSGKGQWSAWKATKLSKKYEEAGGEYRNEPGSKNVPSRGPPKAKSKTQKDEELKTDASPAKETEGEKETKMEKPKANSGKKALKKKDDDNAKASKEKRIPAAGTRKSARLGNKRSAPEIERNNGEDEETVNEEEVKEKAPKKKARTATK